MHPRPEENAVASSNTDDGMHTESSALHPLNALAPTVEVVGGMTTCSKRTAFRKAFGPMLVTDQGMFTDRKHTQSRKASDPI